MNRHSLARQTITIAQRELLIELRARELVPTMTLFAVLVAVLSSMSLFVDEDTGRRVAPGVLWIAVAFAGTLGLSRSWGREREDGALRGVLLAPVSPVAIFFGKSLGSLVFLTLTELVVTPLVALLLHAPLGAHLGVISALLSLGSLGFVLAGTLFGAMIARTRARDLLLAVVLYPLVSPALLCGVVATRDTLGGAPLSAIIDWFKLLVIFDLVFIAGGAFLLGPLLSE